jgi:hypothetical protein
MPTFKMSLSNEKWILYTPFSSRDIELSSNSVIKATRNEDGNITSLDVGLGEKIISIGDDFVTELETVSSPYTVKYIEKVDKNTYILHTNYFNKTSIYILPCLGLTKHDYYYDSYLMNTYIYNYPDCNQLILIYRFSSHESYINFEFVVKQRTNFIKLIDIDKSFVGMIYEVEDKFISDIQLILQGKYSLISPTLKMRIRSFHGLSGEHKFMDVVNRSEKRRLLLEDLYRVRLSADQELESKPILEEEIYH